MLKGFVCKENKQSWESETIKILLWLIEKNKMKDWLIVKHSAVKENDEGQG